MKTPDKKAWIQSALIAAFATVSFYTYQNPHETRLFILERLNDLNNAHDAVIRLTDYDGDGCGLSGCLSISGYLKNIISEQPLDSEAAKSLPSFIGDEYPASPFTFQA